MVGLVRRWIIQQRLAGRDFHDAASEMRRGDCPARRGRLEIVSLCRIMRDKASPAKLQSSLCSVTREKAHGERRRQTWTFFHPVSCMHSSRPWRGATASLLVQLATPLGDYLHRYQTVPGPIIRPQRPLKGGFFR